MKTPEPSPQRQRGSALMIGLILFQGISAVLAIGLLVWRGVALSQMLDDLPTLLEEHAGLLITANTVGQVLGLALLALGLALPDTEE